MKFRNLQIAWSLAWGVVAVLLCVLWVRSCWRADYIRGSIIHHHIQLVSSAGRLLYEHAEGDFGGESFSWLGDEVNDSEFEREQLPLLAGWLKVDIDAYTPSLRAGFCAGETGIGYAIMVPHWFAVLTIATLGAFPWLRWPKRFSLRTLLIATALVAVALGFVSWASRATR